MRVLAIVALAATAVVALVSAGAPQLTVCKSGEALMTNVEIKSPDANWKAETTVSFVVTGNLPAPVTGGTISTQAWFDGMDADNKKEDLCTYKGSPFKCPEAAGAKSWTFPFPIPSVPWSGELTAHSEFRNADGKLLFCMDIAVGL